jgi:hypothetical protein
MVLMLSHHIVGMWNRPITNSLNSIQSQYSSAVASAIEQYSALVLEGETTVCFLELQETRLLPRKKFIVASRSSIIWIACPIRVAISM